VTVTGNTFYTNPMSISVDSNVVAEYTGPHDRPLRKYPEVAMTSASHGGYVASASDEEPNYNAWRAFSDVNTNTDAWVTDFTENRYDVSTGEATTNTPLFEGARGDWIQLQLPAKIKLEYIVIDPRRVAHAKTPEASPGDGRIFGSTDETNWTLITSFSGRKYGGDASNENAAAETILTSTNAYYNYYRLQVTKRAGQSGSDKYVAIGELEYYGHEEGDSSLDTTLKSVYNVPATQQLEVYYDGQDYSVMPTVGSASVTDKAGGDQTGTPSSGVSFDSTYKAFVFDGTANGNITSSVLPSDFIGDIQHTVSLWFKIDSSSTVTNPCLFDVHKPGATVSHQRIDVRIQTGASYQFHYDFWDNYTRWKSPFGSDLPKDEWIHMTATYSGGLGSEARNIYMNGRLCEFVSQATVVNTTPLAVQADSILLLGKRPDDTSLFDGSIANFRLFSKALNAGQVQELYDYQKDYFLGTRSSVTLYKGHLGIGVAEPSGQLELAGDERIQEYPPGPMDGYENYFDGHGVFFASMSNPYTIGRDAWKAFNKVTGNTDFAEHGYTPSYQYGANDGNTLNSYANPANNAYTTNGVVGLWIQLELPYEINLKGYSLTARTTGLLQASRMPEQGIIFGSNNGEVWTAIHNHNDTAGRYTSGIGPRYFSVDGTSTYRYFRLVTTKLFQLVSTSGNERPDISELRFYGTPGPTTLDKGSLTLGRSLDVPRISRYDVDTETPRPEKLVVDFDTTVNSSPTDISGQGNHGVFRESASYSPADKAFNLDGVSKNIRAELNNTETGNQYHSVSLWFKILSGQSSNWRNIFECGENPRSGTSDISLYIPGGQDQLSFSNGGGHMYSDTLTNLYFQWHHIVLTYDGANRNMYLDGALIKTLATTSWAGVANMSLTLGKNNASSGGSEGCDCHISNFKLYWQTALEASEVRKLYNLGRTGRSMVISDTAVGIGKVPEAQLDVRGNLKVSGGIYTGMNYAVFVWLNGAVTVSTANKIPFDTAVYNPLGLWNTSTYQYTCPINGVYKCTATLLTMANSYNGNHEWYVNDSSYSPKLRGHGATGLASHKDASSSLILLLNRGDRLDVRSAGTGEWYGSTTYAHTSANIHLLYPI